MSVFREMRETLGVFMGGDYPRFVTGNRPPETVPVFYFHETDSKDFESKLKYLKENGYQTLDIQGLKGILSGDRKPTGKEVMLTFDDGTEDVYRVVYPLLETYHFCAVVFIAPYWVGEPGVLGWDQIREMEASGVIDFQSHSYSHALIPVSSKITDFYRPQLQGRRLWDLNPLKQEERYPSKQIPEWGQPMYETASGLSDVRCFSPDEQVAKKCIEFVQGHGGEAFFNRSDWKKKLLDSAGDQIVKGGIEKQETLEAHGRRIDGELILSKQILEDKLGKKIEGFAFPHHSQGETAIRLLKKNGYTLVFGGLSKDRGFSDPESGHYFINRVSGDFLYRLPGKGRQSLSRIYMRKLFARFASRGLNV